MKEKLLLFLILFPLILLAYEFDSYSDLFIDVERDNREIDVQIYYPIGEIEEETFPVIIFGHGWLLNYTFYSDFAEVMATSGSIVVFPRTEEGFFPDHQEFALDLIFLAGEIQWENADPASNLFEIVRDLSIAMGHSMGGGCSILAASGNDAFSAVVNFAAAETDPSAIEAALSVNCPSFIFSASEDNITPPETNQLPIYENLEAELKYYVNILNENHLGITANEYLPFIVIPCINYLISNSNDDLATFHAILDSLQTADQIEFIYENNVSVSDDLIKQFDFNLSNYPNPFNPETTISFSLTTPVLSSTTAEGAEPTSLPCTNPEWAGTAWQAENTELVIYNVKGQKIKDYSIRPRLFHPEQSRRKGSDHYFITWNGTDNNGQPVPSGIYFYKLKVGKLEESRKMLLLK